MLHLIIVRRLPADHRFGCVIVAQILEPELKTTQITGSSSVIGAHTLGKFLRFFFFVSSRELEIHNETYAVRQHGEAESRLGIRWG